jgi:hypothetical protein
MNAVTGARRVLAEADRILAAPWVRAPAAAAAAEALRDALEIHEAILTDRIHETAYHPGVIREPEPKPAALRLAAEEITDWVAVLAIALPAALDGTAAAA